MRDFIALFYMYILFTYTWYHIERYITRFLLVRHEDSANINTAESDCLNYFLSFNNLRPFKIMK